MKIIIIMRIIISDFANKAPKIFCLYYEKKGTSGNVFFVFGMPRWAAFSVRNQPKVAQIPPSFAYLLLCFHLPSTLAYIIFFPVQLAVRTVQVGCVCCVELLKTSGSSNQASLL